MKGKKLLIGETFERISSKPIIGPLVITGILAFICFILFYAANDMHFLKTQLWIFLLFITILWVMSSIDYAYRTYRKTYIKSASLFGFGPSYIDKVEKEILNDTKIILFPGIFMILFAEIYIVLTYLKILDVSSTIYVNIYENPVILIYFVILAAIVGYIYSVGMYLTLRHVLFVKNIAHGRSADVRMFRLKKPEEVELIEKRLKDFYHLARYSSLISIAWFGGTTFSILIVTELLKVISLYTSSFLALSIIVGVFIFVLPEKYVHESLKKTKLNLQSEVKEFLKDRWKPDDWPHKYLPEIFETYLILSYIDHLPEWSTNYVLISEEVLGILFPLFGLLYNIHV